MADNYIEKQREQYEAEKPLGKGLKNMAGR